MDAKHPQSLAAILLREHDNVEQAIRYAERKAKRLEAMGHSAACDYAFAAESLREIQRAEKYARTDALAAGGE